MGTNETKHLMALNPFRSVNKVHISSLPLAEYDKLISYPWLHEAILQIRGEHLVVGKDMTAAKLKSQLPFRCAHYFRFQGDKRRQDHIDPESFLFQTSVDIDEAELVETALEMVKLLDESETLGTKNGETIPNPWRGMLLHLEYSARKKLHIDIRMPIGMTIEETQRAYCETLGVPCDESCFSPERIIFVTDNESEIYRSPMWYAVLPDDELARRREAFAKRGLAIDGRKKVKSEERRALEVKSEERRVKNSNAFVGQTSNLSTNNSLQNETEQSTVGGNQVPPSPLSHPADSDSATGDSSAAPHSHLPRGGTAAMGERSQQGGHEHHAQHLGASPLHPPWQ